MPTVEMLCLANSAKHSGRCVAGVRLDTGAWVRPVSSAEDGPLTPPLCTLDAAREVRSLDVVQIELAQPRPERHQPENWVIGPNPWKLIDELSPREAPEYVGGIVERGPELLGDRDDSVDFASIGPDGLGSSLALVRVGSPRFEVNPWNKLRARFKVGDAYYDLSVTDLATWVREVRLNGAVSSTSDWYFTVSLTEPWTRTNRCYKVVAAGVEIMG